MCALAGEKMARAAQRVVSDSMPKLLVVVRMFRPAENGVMDVKGMMMVVVVPVAPVGLLNEREMDSSQEDIDGVGSTIQKERRTAILLFLSNNDCVVLYRIEQSFVVALIVVKQ